MEADGDVPVNSATLFTTLTDFSDQGEVGVFLNDDFVDGRWPSTGRGRPDAVWSA
jgi:polyhydroxyalkanoate synthase